MITELDTKEVKDAGMHRFARWGGGLRRLGTQLNVARCRQGMPQGCPMGGLGVDGCARW